MQILILTLAIIGLLVLGAAINQFIFLQSQEKTKYHPSAIPDKSQKLSERERILWSSISKNGKSLSKHKCTLMILF